MSKIMQELEKLAVSRTLQLQKAKKEGRKVIEYTGVYIPEEYILAAGAEPYLMCRGGEPEPPDAVLNEVLRFMNPLARSMAGFYKLGMDPVTEMADLIVAQQTECHVARITELMEYWKLPIVKVGVPADWTRDIAFEYYILQLQKMVDAIEEVTGEKIDPARASAFMEKTNRVCAALRKIDALRKLDNPPIGTTEFIKLNHWSFMIDPDVMAEKLEALYEELKDAPGKFEEGAPRLLIAGHCVAMGDYTVPSLIEKSGAMIVADFMDEGMRPYKWDIKLTGDPLRDFAQSRYKDRVPSDIFQPAWEARRAYIQELVKEYRVDGVVWYQLVFDEIYDMEYTCLAKWLGEAGIPLIKLESSYEYSREAMGPLTTRVESYIESLKEGK